ncbi:hypothetical protein AV530_011845 [Patagioenas fasciata monilis]|uniref:Uncharacterized protein n=1 Tax=Patagioenas fasciata monilis TaxID=372326 RepID=A0A1V4JU57_PATFA|nr:hypothetical protein AV530_011845 [Patagioenas fasciata monilis]
MKVAVTTVQSVLCLWHLLRILNTIMSKTGKKHPKNGNLLKAPCTFHAEDLADLFLVLSRYLERRWVGSTFLLAAQGYVVDPARSSRGDHAEDQRFAALWYWFVLLEKSEFQNAGHNLKIDEA